MSDHKKEFIEKSYTLETHYENRNVCQHKDRFGLCGTCTHFGFAESEFSIIFASAGHLMLIWIRKTQ